MISNSGDLTELITVLRPIREKDGFGSLATTWDESCCGMHAKVDYGSGGFSVVDGEAVYTASVTFETRWTTQITEYCRIRWEGRLYRIVRIERYRKWNRLRVECELLTQD